MSKMRNKGFSLIEIIIAVAVMTLLISPIIAQVFQTIQTSSRSKETQYVIDNAEMVLEYFRANSLSDLAVTGDKGDAVTLVSNGENPKYYDGKDHYNDPSKKHSKVSCNVWKSASGSYSNSGSVSYSVIDYTLESIQLGKEKNTYSRVVSLDDLSNRVMAETGLEIRHDVTNAELEALKTASSSQGYNWKITTEGNAAATDSDGHVIAVLATDKGGTYHDPNTTTLGNIQNIDSYSMAIIEGTQATTDNQFQQDFISNMVDIIARKKHELIANGTYDDYKDKDKLNDAFEVIRQSNSSSFSRMIKLSITGEDIVGSKPSYYRVTCDVYYKAIYSFLGENFGSDASDNEPFRYNIFSQDFYTSEPPDVLFIYEPFVRRTDSSYVSYADKEYFLVKGDRYTSGSIAGTDASKVYLVKSDSTWAQEMYEKYPSTFGNGLANPFTTAKQGKELNDNYNYFLTRRGSYYPVQLYVNQIVDSSDTGTNPIQIITNVSYKPDATDPDDIMNSVVNGLRQFVTSQISSTDTSVPDMGLLATESNLAYPGAGSAANEIGDITFPDGETKKAITYPLDDKRLEGRLYSITVKFDNLTRTVDATRYFTGAKGAD